MAVKLRLSRHGTTNAPFYWMVASDSRFARDKRYLEKLGTYNPVLAIGNPERLKLNEERIKYWLSVGAQPSDRALKLLSLIELEGIGKFTKKKKSTVGTPKVTKNPDKRRSTKPAAAESVAEAATEAPAEQPQAAVETPAPEAEQNNAAE
jgi:small subunit ribosomal protein S16